MQFCETQRGKKWLPLEIFSLKPSEKKTKMYFLKQYFKQKKASRDTKEAECCVISSGCDQVSFLNEAKGQRICIFEEDRVQGNTL